MANKRQCCILTILIISFVIITILVKSGATVKFDSAISEVVKNTIPEGANKILKVITDIGGTTILPIIVIGICIVLLALKKKKYSIWIFLNALLSTILYTVIKNIIKRPRPFPHYFINETGFSYPSGHTTTNVAVCGLFIYYLYKNVKNKKIKISLIILLSLWIIAIGITRIYFNVHYPSDIVAGFLLGIICIMITKLVEEKCDEKNIKDFQKIQK